MHNLKGPFFLLFSCLLFSVTGTLQQLAPEGHTPVVITEVRMLLGSLTILAWCLFTHRLPSNWSVVPWKPMVIAVASVLLYQLLFFYSVAEVGVAVGSVVAIATTPLWAAAVAFLLFRKKPSKFWAIATALAIVGVCLINFGGGLKLYLKGKSEDPLVQEALSEISTQADRLSKIIQRVRTYAKRQHHEVKKENLSEIIDRALVSFRRSSISTGVDVEVKAPVTANLLADALELELLIVNLLKNAAAACRDSQDKIINVQLSEATNEWMLSVSDHGQVISDKLLSQLSHPTKSLSDGLGLGLSICRLIAESHGGKLTFKPNTPKGLVVTLHLPKVNEEN